MSRVTTSFDCNPMNYIGINDLARLYICFRLISNILHNCSRLNRFMLPSLSIHSLLPLCAERCEFKTLRRQLLLSQWTRVCSHWLAPTLNRNPHLRQLISRILLRQRQICIPIISVLIWHLEFYTILLNNWIRLLTGILGHWFYIRMSCILLLIIWIALFQLLGFADPQHRRVISPSIRDLAEA